MFCTTGLGPGPQSKRCTPPLSPSQAPHAWLSSPRPLAASATALRCQPLPLSASAPPAPCSAVHGLSLCSRNLAEHNLATKENATWQCERGAWGLHRLCSNHPLLSSAALWPPSCHPQPAYRLSSAMQELLPVPQFASLSFRQRVSHFDSRPPPSAKAITISLRGSRCLLTVSHR